MAGRLLERAAAFAVGRGGGGGGGGGGGATGDDGWMMDGGAASREGGRLCVWTRWGWRAAGCRCALSWRAPRACPPLSRGRRVATFVRNRKPVFREEIL